MPCGEFFGRPLQKSCPLNTILRSTVVQQYLHYVVDGWGGDGEAALLKSIRRVNGTKTTHLHPKMISSGGDKTHTPSE